MLYSLKVIRILLSWLTVRPSSRVKIKMPDKKSDKCKKKGDKCSNKGGKCDKKVDKWGKKGKKCGKKGDKCNKKGAKCGDKTDSKISLGTSDKGTNSTLIPQ